MMVDKLPTDNLYKFIAIFGLVIVITSSYFLFYIGHQIQLDWINIKNSAVASSSPLSPLLTMSNILALETGIMANNPKQVDVGRLNELFKNISDFNTQYSEMLGEISEHKSRLEVLDFGIDFYNKVKVKVAIITFVGYLMIFVGFYLWYTKLQKYLDYGLREKMKK